MCPMSNLQSAGAGDKPLKDGNQYDTPVHEIASLLLPYFIGFTI